MDRQRTQFGAYRLFIPFVDAVYWTEFELRTCSRSRSDMFNFSYLPMHSWITLSISTTIVVLVALGVHRVGVVILRRITRSQVMAEKLVQFAERPSRFVLIFFMLGPLWYMAPDELPLIQIIRQVTTWSLIGTLTWLGICCTAAVQEAVLELKPQDVNHNLDTRRIQTQTQMLSRCANSLIILVGASFALMTFPQVRQIGASLLASAGVASLIVGMAARPMLGNLFAGLQIALSQPIRLDDVLIVQDELGRVEEITGTYIVVRVWDERRLIVPLQWFIENPFQNWTRTTSELIGTVFLWVDYRMPLDPLRAELERICHDAPEWDGRFYRLQVTDANEHAIQLRILVTAADASRAWDLRCRVREELLAYIQHRCPEYLPRARVQFEGQRSDACGASKESSDSL